MEFKFSMRTIASSISWHIERKELGKLIRRIAHSLSVFLSIWFETVTEIDTLKIRKKGASRSDRDLLT
jgi:hypothetical protein